MIEDHCQATKQVQLGTPSVKDMDTKIINVLTRTQTLQELQDYIVYLKEVKMSVRKKLEVKQGQQAQRERENAKKVLKEMWEKAKQEKQLKKREEKERREKEEDEQREKHEKKSLLTPLTCMVEMKSLKGDDNALNCCSHSHHDIAFSLGTFTNPSLFVLMPREDLYIKKQWHKQWGEEKMIEKAATTWAKHEPDFNHLIVCLAYHENPEEFWGHSFSILIIMDCSPFCFTVNSILVVKLFDMFCRFIFDPGGQSLSTLIIRDWALHDPNLIFSR